MGQGILMDFGLWILQNFCKITLWIIDCKKNSHQSLQIIGFANFFNIALYELHSLQDTLKPQLYMQILQLCYSHI